jgi:hypothetical protein
MSLPDRVIGPSISTEGMILAEVLMSSSKPARGEVFAFSDLNPANPDNLIAPG